MKKLFLLGKVLIVFTLLFTTTNNNLLTTYASEDETTETPTVEETADTTVAPQSEENEAVAFNLTSSVITEGEGDSLTAFLNVSVSGITEGVTLDGYTVTYAGEDETPQEYSSGTFDNGNDISVLLDKNGTYATEVTYIRNDVMDSLYTSAVCDVLNEVTTNGIPSEEESPFDVATNIELVSTEESDDVTLKIDLSNVPENIRITGYTVSCLNEEGITVYYPDSDDGSVKGTFENLSASEILDFDGPHTITIYYVEVSYDDQGNPSSEEKTFVTSINNTMFSELYGEIQTYEVTENSLKVQIQTATGYKDIDDPTLLDSNGELLWDLGTGNNTQRRLLKVIANFSETSNSCSAVDVAGTDGTNSCRSVIINIPEGYRIFDYSVKKDTDQIYKYNCTAVDTNGQCTAVVQAESNGNPVNAVTQISMTDSESNSLYFSKLTVPTGDPFGALSLAGTTGQEFGMQMINGFMEDPYNKYGASYTVDDADGYEIRPGKLEYYFNNSATVASIYVTIIPDDYTNSHQPTTLNKNTVNETSGVISNVNKTDIQTNSNAYYMALNALTTGKGQLLKDLTVEMKSGDFTDTQSLKTRVVSGPVLLGADFNPSTSQQVINGGVSNSQSIGLLLGIYYSTNSGTSVIGRQLADEVIVKLTYPEGVIFDKIESPFTDALDENGDGIVDENDSNHVLVTDNGNGTSTVAITYDKTIFSGGQYYSNTVLMSVMAMYPYFHLDGNYYMAQADLDDGPDSAEKHVGGVLTNPLKESTAMFNSIEVVAKPRTYGYAQDGVTEGGSDDYSDYTYYSKLRPYTIVAAREVYKIQVYPRDVNRYNYNIDDDFPDYRTLSSIYVKNNGNTDPGEVQMIFKPTANMGLKALYIPVPSMQKMKDVVVWTTDGKVYTADGRAVTYDSDGDGEVDTTIATTIAVPELADLTNTNTTDYPTTIVDMGDWTDGNGTYLYPNRGIDADGNYTNVTMDRNYISRVQCTVTDYPSTNNPLYGSNYTGYKGVFYGLQLDNNTCSATMIIQKVDTDGNVITQAATTDVNGDGNIDANDQVPILKESGTANVKINTNEQIDAYASGGRNKATYVSGETIKMYANAFAYSNIGVATDEYYDPTTYLTVPDGFSLDLSSIELRQYYRTSDWDDAQGNNSVNYAVIDPSKYLITYDEDNKTYKIEFIEKYSALISSAQVPSQNLEYFRVIFNMKVDPTFEGNGSAYSLKDIVFMDLGGTSVTSQVAQNTVVKDVRNVAGKGTNYLGIAPVNIFSVVPLTDLVVNNGIRAKDSGDDFYYYNGNATSIALVNADKEAEIKISWSNVSDSIYENAEIYMPIPRKGVTWTYFNNTVLSDVWNQTPDNKEFEWSGYLVEEINLPNFTTYYCIDAADNGEIPDDDANAWVPVVPSGTGYWTTTPSAAELAKCNAVKFVSTSPILPQTDGSTIFRIRVSEEANVDMYDYWRTLNSVQVSDDSLKRWSFGSVMAATPAAGTVSGQVFIDEKTNNGVFDNTEGVYDGVTNHDYVLILSEATGKIVPISIPINDDGTFRLERTQKDNDGNPIVDANGNPVKVVRYLPSGNYIFTVRSTSDKYHITKYVNTVFGALDEPTGLPSSITWGNDIDVAAAGNSQKLARANFPLPDTMENDPTININTGSKYIGIGLVVLKDIVFDFETGPGYEDSDHAKNTGGVTITSTGIKGYTGETLSGTPTLNNAGGYTFVGWHVYVDGVELLDDNGDPVLLAGPDQTALRNYVLPVGAQITFKGIFTRNPYTVVFRHSSLYEFAAGQFDSAYESPKGTYTTKEVGYEYLDKVTEGPTITILDDDNNPVTETLFMFLNWSYDYIDANGIHRQGILTFKDEDAYLDLELYGTNDGSPIILTANYAKKPYFAAQSTGHGTLDVDQVNAFSPTLLFDTYDMNPKPSEAAPNTVSGYIKYQPDEYYFLTKITAVDLYGNECVIDINFDKTNGEAAINPTSCQIGMPGIAPVTVSLGNIIDLISFTGFTSDSSSVLTTLEFEEYPVHKVNFWAWAADKPDTLFDANEGIHVTQKIGQATTKIPTADGYTFKGWIKENNIAPYTDTVPTVTMYDPNTVMDIIDQDYYALWQKNTYTVIFVDSEGNEIDTPQSVYYEDAATEPAQAKIDAATKPGYTFVGWDKTFDKITGDLTVTAQFTRDFHIVSFIDHDGTILSTKRYGYGDQLEMNADPVHDGYTFVNWFLDAGYTTALNYSGDYAVTQDQDIYAYCTEDTPITYTVTFLDPDDNLISQQIVNKGDDATEPVPPNRPNETFVGWDKEFTNINGDLTVKAIYKANDSEQLVVKFVDHDDTTVLKVQLVDKGGNATPPANPVHDDMVFVNWDKAYTNIQEDTTITARCITKRFTVTYVDDKGTVISTEEVPYGGNGTYPNPPTETGYDFVGWDKDNTNITQDTTITSIMNKQKFNVVFKVEDTNGQVINIQEVPYGDGATEPDAPVIPGKTFVGWDKTFNYITGDLEVYAKYADEPDTDKINVYFLDHDDSVVQIFTNQTPGTSVINTDPSALITHPGYTFQSWTRTRDGITFPYTVPADAVVDVYIKAVCISDTYNVKFVDSDYDDTNPDPTKVYKETEVNYGLGAIPPTTPTKPGYSFIGWDTDYSRITGDLIVKAVWRIDRYYAEFINDDSYLFYIDDAVENANPLDNISGEDVTGPTTDPTSGVDTTMTFLGFKGESGKIFIQGNEQYEDHDLVYNALYKKHSTITPGGDRIGGNDFTHDVNDGKLTSTSIITLGKVEAFDSNGDPIPPNLLTVNQTDLDEINRLISLGKIGTYPVRITTPDGTEVTIFVTLVKRPKPNPLPVGPWLVTYLDCKGNTVKVEWVGDGQNSTKPNANYSDVNNVHFHYTAYPNNCGVYRVPNTGVKDNTWMYYVLGGITLLGAIILISKAKKKA